MLEMVWPSDVCLMEYAMPDISLRVICYVCAVLVGVFVSVVELLGRYRSGNRPSWVLTGWAQYVYYFLNGFSGAAAVFVAEASGEFSAIASSSESSLVVIKAVGLGASAMFVLRSSLFSVAGADGDSKIDIGPAHILNVLNKYLDQQIDKKRGSSAWNEVVEIMKGLSSNQIYPDILACLLSSETLSNERTAALKSDLEALMGSVDWKSAELKAIAMGLLIQKELGSEALRNVVAAIHASPSLQVVPKDVQSIDAELDNELKKLWDK